MNFAVLGGDLRQRKLAEWLAHQGHHTVTWGHNDPENRLETELTDALAADVIILPLPVSRDGSHLNTSFASEQPLLSEIWRQIGAGRTVLAGNVSKSIRQAAAEYGLQLTDYYEREELQIRNAVTTAEGALQCAMAQQQRCLCCRKCLVIGFGRIGKVLAHRLRGLQAEVTVSARKQEDLAWIEAMGYGEAETEEAVRKLDEFEIIFNTVPALLLGEQELSRVSKDTVLIDLASEPGGTDFAAAERLGVSAVWARGLPGKTAPQSAAEDIGRTIFHILEERVT